MNKIIAAALCLALSASAQTQETPIDDAAVRAANQESRQYLEEGRLTEAMAAAEKAFKLGQQVYGANNPNTASLALNFGQFLAHVGAREHATYILQDALALHESLYGPDAIEVVPVLVALGGLYQFPKLYATVKRALTIQNTASPNDRLAYAKVAAKTGAYLALSYRNQSDAVPVLEEALEIYTAQYGKGHEKLIPVLMSLGDAHASQHSPGKQTGYYQRALKIAKAGPDKIRYADLLHQAGLHFMQLSGSPKSGDYLKKAHKMYLGSLGPEHFKTGNALLSIGRFEIASGRPKRAEPHLLTALEAFKGNADLRTHELKTLGLLVQVYEDMGRSDEATPYCRAIGQVSPWTDVQAVMPLFKRQAEFPPVALALNSGGFVIVEYTVDEEGFVRSPSVVEYVGHKSLASSALEAARDYRYAPRFENGQAVATDGVRTRIKFEIVD